MATSGTIGQTVYSTQQVIDRAYRNIKLPPQQVTSEMLHTALEELWLMLMSLANTGVPLWCITRYLLPMYLGKFTVPCPVGTVDVLNANLRTTTQLQGSPSSSEGDAENAFDHDLDTACVQTLAAGWIALELESEDYLTTVGILPGASGTWDISLQYSDDGVTYTTFETYAEFAAVDGEWQWFDFEGLPAKLYWRLKANNATILDVIELAFDNNPSAIPCARINKDDYTNLPSRAQRGRPVQYWMDRQIEPVMQVWPAPNVEAQFQQLEVWVHRKIQDVGTLQQQLELPDRWYDAISLKLATKLLRMTPDAKLTADDRMQLMTDTNEAWTSAWAEERDPSPMYLAPDISPYTA